jgi:hypothetical protein
MHVSSDQEKKKHVFEFAGKKMRAEERFCRPPPRYLMGRP